MGQGFEPSPYLAPGCGGSGLPRRAPAARRCRRCSPWSPQGWQPSRALPEPLVWGTPTLRLPPPHPLPRPPLRPSQWCSSRELAFDSPACCPLTASSPVPRGCPLTDLHRKPIPSCSHFAFEVAAGNPGADRPAAGGADQPALSSKEQGQGHRAQGAQPDHPQAPCHPCA